MRRYTGFVQFGKDPNRMEEIDVDARNESHARQLIKKEVEEGYENPQSAKIVKVKEQIGMYGYTTNTKG